MRSRLLATVLAAVSVLAGVAGCSTSRGEPNDGTLRLTASAAIATFVRNWNVLSPVAQKGPGATFFYEPLVRIDYLHGYKVRPWLARSWHYSPDGKTLTFRLRPDATWTDGRALTAADVAYTFNAPKKNPKLGLAAYPFSSAEAVGAHTVVVHYPTPGFHDLVNFSIGGNRNIVPEHIWAHHNLSSWTNPTPVGSGPFTLESFSPQLIRLKVRPHYWGGGFHGVKHVEIKPYGTIDVGEQMMLRNELSWSTMCWQDPQQNFVKRGQYNQYPVGLTATGTSGVLFNNSRAPTDNVHLRRALYAAIDPPKITTLYDVGQLPANPTGLSAKAFSDFLPTELQGKRHAADAELARKELAASGYTVHNGALTKGGKTYPLSLKLPGEYLDWVAYSSGLQQGWQQILGLHVPIVKQPLTQLLGQEQEGDFTMVDEFINGGTDIYTAYNGQLASSLAPAGKKATGNYERYHNPAVDKLLTRMAGTNNPTVLRDAARAVGRIVERDVPYAPIHEGNWCVNINATDWTGWPDPKTADYVPHTLQGPDATLTIQHLAPRRR